MLQPFATTNIVFDVIRVHGEIDRKFELLVVDGNNPQDM
jgi:hypothetical protein